MLPPRTRGHLPNRESITYKIVIAPPLLLCLCLWKIIGPNGRGGRSRGSGGATLRKPRGGGAEIEGQGVTSWSSDDLRVKYRAEREREEAYQAFRLEEQVAEALDQDYGQVGVFQARLVYT